MDLWMMVVLAIAATVGVLQWAKGWAPNAPSWVWRLVLLVASAAWGVVVAVVAKMSLLTGALYAGLILAACQIGYEILIEGIAALLKQAVAYLKVKLGGGGP